MNNNSNRQPLPAKEEVMRPALAARWTLPAIAGLLLLFLIATIPGYHLHIDEAWIGEQAYFLSRDGYVHSTLFEGFAGNEVRTVVYHRLFVLLGSWCVSLFGWSIGTLRVVPLAAGGLLLALMAHHMRRELGASWRTVALAIAIFLLIPLNFTYIKVFRPEMLMTLCGFAGYWALGRFMQGGRRWNLPVAAIAGGMAALAHPYGAIFPLCGILMLLGGRRWRGAALFAAVAVLPAIPYIIDIATHYELFHRQISNPLVAEKTRFTILTPLLNLLEEHKRLFRKPEIILPTLLFILSLVAGVGREGWRRFHLIYSVLLVMLLGAAAQDKVVRYAIPLLPFFTIAIAVTAGEWIERPIGNRFWRAGFALVLVLFIGVGIDGVINDLRAEREHVPELNAAIAASIPPGTRCLAPMNFIFEQIGRYPIIALRYANMEQRNWLEVRAMLDFADRHRADAIIINTYATLDEGIIDLGTAGEDLARTFRIAASTPEYTLFLRRR